MSFSTCSIRAALALALGVAVLPAQNAPAPAAPGAPRVLRGRSATASGVSRRGYLGVGVADLSPERARALRLPDDNGVEVKRVDDASPAAKAGLKEADVILELNDRKVEDVESFVGSVADSAPGSKVAMVVWRNGGKLSLSATLAARPAAAFSLNGPDSSGWLVGPMPPMPPMTGDGWEVLTGQAPRVGFEGETLTPQLADYFGVKEGVLVRTVNEKTPAAKAGLKAGDVIFKINGTPVANTREISGMVRASRRNVTFTVMRNHREILLNLEIAQSRIPSPDREVL